MGVSPKQDAQVQLSLAGKAAPAEALQKFLGQEGVTAGPDRPAPSTEPRGPRRLHRPEPGREPLDGLVAFITYGGNTYQLLGLTTRPGGAAYGRVFDQFIGQLPAADRPGGAQREAEPVSVVRVTQPMTLAEFNRRYPSVIAIEELALINGAGGWRTRSWRRETSVKRVVAQ